MLDRGVSRDWYANTSQCNAAAKAAAQAARPGIPLGCDEFPYYSTAFSGPGASLRFIRSDHNRSEGQWLGAFYNNGRCAPKVKVARVPYLVVPMPADEAPATMYVC